MSLDRADYVSAVLARVIDVLQLIDAAWNAGSEEPAYAAE